MKKRIILVLSFLLLALLLSSSGYNQGNNLNIKSNHINSVYSELTTPPPDCSKCYEGEDGPCFASGINDSIYCFHIMGKCKEFFGTCKVE